MPARDVFHNTVRNALTKDIWKITHDPLTIHINQDDPFYVDLGAEKILAAEKSGRKIAVEVKDFNSASLVNDLEKMIGQMQLYQLAIDEREPDRELFLAISFEMYDWQYRKQRSAFRAIVERNKINLIILDEIEEVIQQWIRQ